MRIEVWSDVVCPWCYIGKRRLEAAVAAFAHAGDIQVVYRSFQLDPSAPRVETESVAELLGRKYGGGPEAGQQMVARVCETARSVGLDYTGYPRAMRGNTLDAHRLLHLALDTGGPEAQGRLKETLLASYFVAGEPVADHDVLTRNAVSSGLDETRVRAVLAGDEYAQAVQDDVELARSFGAGGVPFFVLDRRYAVSGAQPEEVFAEALTRAWDDAHAPTS